MAARRYDDDDDWDDSGEFEEVQIEEEPGILTTTRILVGLLVVVVIAIVASRLLLREKPEFSEVSPALIGLWTTTHPVYNDEYVEFRKKAIKFGLGGTREVKFQVQGMDIDKVGDINQYSIFYRDLAGTPHEVEMFLDESGEILRFTDRAEARWTRWRDRE
jgi:hypothetical protein